MHRVSLLTLAVGLIVGTAMLPASAQIALPTSFTYQGFVAGNGPNVTVVVMSEFGRRLLENGNLGTDHGHGNVMMVLGQCVGGGRVMTQWPGLEPQNLFEGRDLQVTIDYRDILSEIVQDRLEIGRAHV